LTLAPIDAVDLPHVVDARYERSGMGLEHHAFQRWHASRLLTPWGRTHMRSVGLFANGQLLASAVGYALSGFIDRRPIRVCGIGHVLSHAGNADPGPSHQLITQLVDDAAGAGAQMALLFGTAVPEWASRNGFHAVVTSEVELTMAPTPRPGAPMTLVRGGEDRDLASIAAMGSLRAASFRFSLDRDVDLVQHAIMTKRMHAGLGPSGNQELQFFIAEEGITAAAYIVLSVVGSNWTIEECGDRDPGGARVGALLQALVAREPTSRPPAIRGWLPPGFCPPQAHSAVRTASTGGIMAAFLGSEAATPPLAAGDTLYWHGDLF